MLIRFFKQPIVILFLFLPKVELHVCVVYLVISKIEKEKKIRI